MGMEAKDYIAIAAVFGTKSTCGRAHVGAIIVRKKRIISTGYNGAPSGMAHCKHGGDNFSCTRAVHAEANAIAWAARTGTPTDEATLYTTMSPCLDCAKLIIQSGIITVVFLHEYHNREGKDLLGEAGVEVIRAR